MITLEEYLQEDESSPFGRWISTLSVQAALKVSNAMVRLELGNTSNIKWFDGLGEYKINWGPRLPDLPDTRRKTSDHFVWWRRQIDSKERHQTGESLDSRIPNSEKS